MCGCKRKKFSSNCLRWEGKDYEICDFNELFEKVADIAFKLNEDHEIDIKSLSESCELSRDSIIQILIDNVIRLKNNKPVQSNLTAVNQKLLELQSQIDQLNQIILN